MEVLVSCMNQTPNIYKKMNIQTDAIIVNQTNQLIEENLRINEYDGRACRFYSFNEFGVGLSRNTALMRAKDGICIVADEDEVFVNNYEELISEAYRLHPDADMIVFDVRIHQRGKIQNRVNKEGRVRLYNALKYGSVTFTFKRNSILKHNIFFSLLFGGGAMYLSGEDSLFIRECLKKHLKVYSCKSVIADVYNENSTWFKGYNEKYLIDRGALFKAMSRNWYWFYIFQFSIRKRRLFSDIGIKKSIELMFEGSASFTQSNF